MDNLEDIVLDEIALEGLNGVSLERLWVLLEQRKAPFPLKLDDHTKNFIWQDLLCHHQTISFYTVPEQFQQLNDGAAEGKAPARRHRNDKAKKDEAMIDDLETKERGYCLCYKQRTNVTAQIRKGTKSDCPSLQQVIKKYGNSLVVVASQEARLHALISQVTSPDVFLQTIHYCCLEHLGRCRYQGASQSSIALKFDVGLSYVFHMCKILLKLGVAIKETIENHAHIYLIRFKPQSQITRKTKVADQILDFLANQPNKMVPRYELVEHVLKSEDATYSQFRKALKDLKSAKLIVAENNAAKDLPQFSCPEVEQSMAAHLKKIKTEEGESANTGRKLEDFVISCIRLVDADADDGLGDNDDDADLDLKEIHASQEIDFSRLSLNLELTDMQQVYYCVEKNQNELNGVSINQAVHALMMDRYRVRLIFRRLAGQQLIRSFTFTTGRLREKRYFTQRGLDEETVSEQILHMYHQEKKKLHAEQTRTVVDGTPNIPSPSEAGGSSDHVDSSPGISQPSENSKKASQNTEPTRTFKPTQSWRNLERSRLILEHIKHVHAIEMHLLYKHIKKSEAEMGSKTQCCRKSLFRMVQNLAKEGKLNYFTKEILRRGHSKKETIKIVSDVSTEEDDPQVQALLADVKIKPTIPPQTDKMPVLYQKLKANTGKKSVGMSDVLKSKMQHTNETRKTMERYGYAGKMERLDALHKFLWYILYENKEEGEVKLEPLKTISPGDEESWETSAMAPGWEDHKMGQANIAVAQSIRSNTTASEEGQGSKDTSPECEEPPRTHIKCYMDTTDPSDWRRYVPPGRGHVGRVKGWATMNDILSTIPLSVFVKINSVVHPVPGLDETLQHPRMRHYPINILSLHLFHGSSITRSITNIHSCLVALSGMGLLYFDCDRRFQPKNQVNFYLCRSGSFLDTTTSAPGFDQIEDKEYPWRTYQFTSLENVTQFWLDFKMTCFGTPLGVIRQKSSKVPKETKTLLMVADSINEAPPDPTTIPGDHRGAGGLDTSFFAHRSINWGKIRCKSKTKKRSPKAEFVVKSETENRGEEKDCTSEKLEVKRIKVSAKEHKNATVGGKGQKRKSLKIKSKSQKDTARKESAPVPGPTVSGTEENAARKEGAPVPGPTDSGTVKEAARKESAPVSGPTDSGILEDAARKDSAPISRPTDSGTVGDAARKDSLPVPGPTDSGTVEEAVKDKSMVEIANQEGKKLKGKAKSKTPLARNRHIYDDDDLVATQRKILRRVKWNAREDNFLLLCGLCLRILRVKCAKSDKRKRFVGWPVIRDLLQENLEESRDKTADAASRRFRLLLKDHTNMSNFSVCLTDIQADKEIMGEFMTRKRDYEDEAVCKQEFRELCMTLAKKFECRDKSEILVLPSTLKELYEKYDVMTSNLPVATTVEEFETRDVRSEEEITSSILSNIVLISMLSHHFKQHYMREIYFALRRYDPLMLQKAVDRFKRNGFMGRNRNGIMDIINTKRALHVVPMSFQFTKTFFNLFNAPSIPRNTLDATSTTLGGIMAACRKESGDKSNEDEEAATVCINDLEGNKSSIMCIPALELASDTLEIPKDIISLELSPSERVRLQKKHEEEMMREVDDGDLDEDDDEDDNLSEKPREAKRKASEISEDMAPRKLKRQLQVDIARRRVEIVRNAHKEWCQTLAGEQASKPKKTKDRMSSLIPRLLKNEVQQKMDVDSDSSRTNEPSKEPFVNDPLANARRSLALDHDYFIKEEDKTLETSHDGDQSEVSCQPMSEETAATSEDTIQVDRASSPSKASSDDVSKAKPSDSFFAWLTMRGFLTQEYSRKPQNIHEDITVHRCTVHMKPKARLLQILDKYFVFHQQDPLQDTQIPENNGIQRNCSSQPSNLESEGQCRDNTGEHGNQSTTIPLRKSANEGKLIPHEENSSLSWHSENKSGTMRTIPPGHVQSLGELVYQPCGPVQAFQSPTLSSDLRPSLEYIVREPCRILKDVCKGHEHSELMRTIFQLVKGRGSLGLTYPHLLDSLGLHRQNTRSKVFNCLRILLQEQLILEVGTTVVRLVAQVCASPWLLKSVRSTAVPITTPSESNGLANPVKKKKVSEQSISQARVTNGDCSVRDELETRTEEEGLPDEGTLPPYQVDSSSRVDINERLQEESLISGGESAVIENEKNASEKDGSSDVMAADGNVSGLRSQLRGKKRKKTEKKEKGLPEVTYEPITIQCHPWTNINGSVNSKSLTMFVSSIGLLIISKPGIKESDIFHHFQNVMAPVDCLHLIKILVNADIISRHSTYSNIKLNLFGPPINTKPKSVVFYQPTVGALMNLALLKDNLLHSNVGES